MVRAADRDGQLELGPVDRVDRQTVAVPQHRQIEGVPTGDEATDRLEEGQHAVLALAVERDSQVGLVAEDPTGEPGQHGVGTDLDEGAHTGIVQSTDGVDEVHGARDLAAKTGPDLIGTGLVRSSGLAGPHRQ